MVRLPKIAAAIAVATTLLASPLLASPSGAETTWQGDLQPITAAEWNADRAAHLLERAGCGGTPDEIAELAALKPEEAVRKIVRWQAQPNVPLAPFLASNVFPSDDFVPPLDGDLERLIVRAIVFRGGLGVDVGWNFDEPFLQGFFDQFFYLLFANSIEMTRVAHWQANRMLRTKRPLEEKLALFWHGHFATANEKVRDYRKMMRQWDLFREKGNGPFRELLLGVCRDPAMLIYLDGQRNVRGAPNENFAREIMELFSLGVGNYSEADIQDAGRAFTGWGLAGNEFDHSFWSHDHGKKTVLGRTGRLEGEDVVDAILEEPAAARFLTAKLYRYFVREELEAATHEALAATLRDNGYETAALLERIFLSRDFYSNATKGARIKSPVELIVSTYRRLGLDEVPGAPYFSTTAGAMGQDLYMPPNVAGWKGGRTWINPSTLILRQNFARHLLFPQELPRLEKSLMETLVVATVGQDVYDQMQRLAAEGDRSRPPTMSMQDMGFARVEDAGGEAVNFAWAIYNGAEKAVGALRFDVPPVASFRLAEMLASADARTADAAVEYLTHRFLSVPARDADRRALVRHLEKLTGGAQLDFESDATEKHLREVLHLILSMPEYQVT
jgi:hypothetical protein